MPQLSIVMPAYNERDSIAHAVNAIRVVLQAESIDFEIIIIDDGSKDDTFAQIKTICKTHQNVRGYRFSRNFGKESAIWAGLQKVKGDCCIVMDCDLQHPAEVLPIMHKKWQEGIMIVEGIKKSRGKESFFYRLSSSVFYKLISRLSGFNMKFSSDFKLLDRQVVNELLQLNERNTFFRGLSFWIGFPSEEIEYEVAPRTHGNSSWNFFNLVKYAINNIAGFSAAPLQLVTGIGTLLVIASLILSVQTLIHFFSGTALAGFTTVILLLLLIGGSLMISLGIIGLYIAKIYEEVKGRPRFIISESVTSQ